MSLISGDGSFIAAAFPPLLKLVGWPVMRSGDVFPEFTHHGKSDYHCEVCIPYQRWAKTNSLKHSVLKSKHVNTDDIINGTAVLNFSGVVQAREHFISKAHQEAIHFFKNDATEKVAKVNEGKPA